MSGRARHVVQARRIEKVVIVMRRPFGRRTMAVSAICLIAVGVIAFIGWHYLDRPNGQAVPGTPFATRVTAEPVHCRSGWVVPDHGQQAIPYVPGGQPTGAVLSSGGNIVVTVQGTTGRTVVLQSMTVVVARRGPAMPGIYLPEGCQEVLTPRKYVLDLDSPRPRVVPQPGSISFPYKISSDDPEQFVITPEVISGDIAWRLYLTWTSGDRRGETALGGTFRTTTASAARKFCIDSSGVWKSAC